MIERVITNSESNLTRIDSNFICHLCSKVWPGSNRKDTQYTHDLHSLLHHDLRVNQVYTRCQLNFSWRKFIMIQLNIEYTHKIHCVCQTSTLLMNWKISKSNSVYTECSQQAVTHVMSIIADDAEYTFDVRCVCVREVDAWSTLTLSIHLIHTRHVNFECLSTFWTHSDRIEHILSIHLNHVENMPRISRNVKRTR